MFGRWIEDGLLDVLDEEGIGCICFSPLAQGLLTSKYLGGDIPEGSRAAKPHGFLRPDHITDEKLSKARRLNDLAQARGQRLAQLSLIWVLRHESVTSALIGASKVTQIEDTVAALEKPDLTLEELTSIEVILGE